MQRNIFQKKGLVCTIETFQNAEWFLGGLGEEQFDIYILDVEMPRKTGLEVAREIRKRYPEPVLIFATNFADYAIEAYEVNTYRYIPKEVLEEKLKAALDALLPQILEREEKYSSSRRNPMWRRSDIPTFCISKKMADIRLWYIKEGRAG